MARNRLKSGAVVPSNMHVRADEAVPMGGMFNTTQVYLGQIKEIIYTDSDRNRSGRFVEYDIVINDGTTQSVYRNVRALDSFGDENNFQEKIFTKTTEGRRGKKDDAETFHFKNGAIVLVAFIKGHKENAVIVGGLQHPNVRLESPTNQTPEFSPTGSSSSRDTEMTALPTLNPGAIEADDKRVLGEFQGLRWNINKDGELTIIFQGPKDCQGKLTNTEAQPTIMKFNKDGEFIVIDNLDQEIKISRKDGKILISDGNETPDFIEIDRNTKNITIQTANDELHKVGNDYNAEIGNDQIMNIKNNTEIDVGGDRNITTQGFLKEITKGDHLAIVAGKRREAIGGQWRVVSGSEITMIAASSIRLIAPSISLINQDETVIGSDNIKIGGIGATEPVMLGTAFQTLYNALISLFNSHTHSGITPGGGTSGPPTSTAPTMTSTELSDTVKVDKTFSGNPDSSDI